MEAQILEAPKKTKRKKRIKLSPEQSNHLAYILSDFQEIFEENSYNNFVKRWSAKYTTQSQTDTLERAIKKYSYFFTRDRIIQAISTIGYNYGKLETARKNAKIYLIDDSSLQNMILIELPENSWKVAIGDYLEKNLEDFNSRTETDKMAYKLFMASLVIVKTELKREARIRRTSIISVLKEKLDEIGSKEPIETDFPGYVIENGKMKVLPADMFTLEEQVIIFGLNPETYFY